VLLLELLIAPLDGFEPTLPNIIFAHAATPALARSYASRFSKNSPRAISSGVAIGQLPVVLLALSQ